MIKAYWAVITFIKEQGLQACLTWHDSVDLETDELMQRVIQEELKGRTLIAVAHKLHTVVDYDRIVLIDKGKIIECGNPRVLLQNPTSAFYKLYTSTTRNVAG